MTARDWLILGLWATAVAVVWYLLILAAIRR